MTEDIVKRLLELEAKATKGPWRVEMHDDWVDMSIEPNTSVFAYGDDESPGGKNPNAELLVELRNAAPALLRSWLEMREALRKIAKLSAITRGGCCGICGAGEDDYCGENCMLAVARAALEGGSK